MSKQTKDEDYSGPRMDTRDIRPPSKMFDRQIEQDMQGQLAAEAARAGKSEPRMDTRDIPPPSKLRGKLSDEQLQEMRKSLTEAADRSAAKGDEARTNPKDIRQLGR